MDAVESSPPNSGSREPGDNPASTSTGKGDQPPQSAKKTAAKKRTKTGCLTCRRRRIKCDEGKPTCNNCIKSKRDCEGYSQRLTFKEPLGSFPSGHFYGHPAHHPQAQRAIFGAQNSAMQTKAGSSQGQLAAIAPKLPSTAFSGAAPLTFGHGYGPTSTAGASSFNREAQLLSPPFLSPDSDFLAEHLLPSTQRTSCVQGEFIGQPTAAIQGLQPQQPTMVNEQPAFTGHHASVSGPQQVLVSPQSAGELFGQPLPGEQGYWQSDDEASMVDSDEEDMHADPHLLPLESDDPAIRLARRLEPHRDLYGVRLRSFGGMTDDNILDTYTPSSASSPLNDPHTATIFWYFVNVTGQSMSLYERHPSGPTPAFHGHSVPKQCQHIWTYTLPIMAFNHPALMQAILALGSLQMAKLQGSPPTAAMKHYHLSLRRVAKNYQSPYKRTQPATLAATLLLGFYEVWNSDHDKWCKHMWGARAVIRDLPLRQLTCDVLAYKRRRWLQMLQGHHADPAAVDTELIFQLTGQRVNYDVALGHIIGDSTRPLPLTERDVEKYETIRDLYFWYCKMDVYQSFLGGTRLLMEYTEWTQCVPRAPCGGIDSAHGTFDFLLLLLGRLANFASRDLARKRKARKSHGPGQGPGPRPGPGGGPSTQGPGGAGPGTAPLSFPGLMPASGRITVPRGFTPPPEFSPSSEPVEDVDPDIANANAMGEWEEIRQAFETFRSHLGPDFEPMGPDFAPPEMTPFGPALVYRTYSIAGIWMHYYMGLIVLHRSHPSMPPVAVLAAGMAAQQTGQWANEIARISAGLHEDTTNMPVISTLFRDLPQRHWTIRRLREVTRLTGWQTARQIADGCETAWSKAAEAGRGPPYHSPPELGPLFPESVWNRPRQIERRIRGFDAPETRLVLAKSEQAHFALGLLSVERDLDRLDVGDDAEG
ncbi:fungal transcriptional regulatory-like protein [Corynascus novoguineensis]|uniref:Fungal transcriptional regulatory-like protein n=1 Tax=Corynascus novoguineensis TaxID=1126955 RepID=A0AAN7CNG4_9PEZI|nr:fungal transcriptional regulatory-like protein [Corynascus novoguineensis]